MTTNNSEVLISLSDVSLRFAEQTTLHAVNLSIKQREIVTIIGPNGAGKSSLIKIAAGLIAPTTGEVKQKRGLVIGYVPQNLRLDNSMPIKVSRFLSLNHASKAQYRDALTQVGGAHLWSKQMHTLSGGEFQRVLLARAVSRQPDLLLLDEPLQGVDVTGQIELYRLISAIRQQQGCAIAMVSHDLHLVMAQTDRVICLNKHICCEGQPESVSEHPEYINLFGRNAASDMGIYTHHHDHHHTLHGDIEACGERCNHD